MDYCKYHPVSEATYVCKSCDIAQCDHCVDEGDTPVRCFVCGGELESLGLGESVAPFWRRLDQCFAYPMKKETLMLIAVASIVAAIGASIGGLLGIILSVIVTAITTKYSFLCLQQTASGNMQAPEVSEAYSGGLTIIIHIIAILIGISLMVYGVANTLGDMAAALFLLFWFFCLPAVFINYARFEEILPAINPIEVVRLVLQLGGSYLLLLLFITIMVASIGTLNQLLEDFYFFSTILQSVVSYYYWIVIYHLMGYLIFQKQRSLGYVSRLENESDVHYRSEKSHLIAKIEVMAKEGMFHELSEVFRVALKKYPNDLEIFNRYFDFLCALHKKSDLDKFWPDYLTCLEKNGRTEQVPGLLQRILHFDPDYLPATAIIRYKLAVQVVEQGKPSVAIKLINGLHRDHPKFDKLPEAYLLMADALEEIPDKQPQAKKCRVMANKLKERQLAMSSG